MKPAHVMTAQERRELIQKWYDDAKWMTQHYTDLASYSARNPEKRDEYLQHSERWRREAERLKASHAWL